MKLTKLTRRSSVPIWTAFITDQVLSPGWLRRDTQSRNTIILSELHHHVFSSDFKPTSNAEGYHTLEFREERGIAISETPHKGARLMCHRCRWIRGYVQ
jgi:hypothetical protein